MIERWIIGLFLGLALTIGGTLAGIVVWFHFGPFSYLDHPVRKEAIAHLSKDPNPVESALGYLYFGVDPSDRPNREHLKISSTDPSAKEECVVTIISPPSRDGSYSVICDRLTLRRENEIWKPIRHQAAWQARGHFGWTTKTPLQALR